MSPSALLYLQRPQKSEEEEEEEWLAGVELLLLDDSDSEDLPGCGFEERRASFPSSGVDDLLLPLCQQNIRTPSQHLRKPLCMHVRVHMHAWSVNRNPGAYTPDASSRWRIDPGEREDTRGGRCVRRRQETCRKTRGEGEKKERRSPEQCRRRRRRRKATQAVDSRSWLTK